jgi:hypothetical protein
MRFTGGMQPDANIYDYVDGTWVNAKNIRRVNNVIEVDYGTVDVSTIGGEVVGVCNTGTALYIFSSEQTAGRDRISKFDGTSVTLLLYADLDLTPNVELQVVYKYNEKGEVVLAWIDSINKLKVLNIDNLPFINGIDPVTKELSVSSDLDLITNCPVFDQPTLSLKSEVDGIYNAGVYQVCIRYKYKDVITNWSVLSNRVIILGTSKTLNYSSYSYHTLRSLYNDNVYGMYPYLFNSINNKSLELTLYELDTSYQYIDIAVIKSLDAGAYESTVGLITNIKINNYSEFTVKLSGRYDSYTELSDILNKSYSILAPKSITNFRDKLLIGNYSSIDINDDPRDILSNLTINWKAEKSSSKSATFQWGEVYAFYAAYVYEDGTKSPYFHIYGREHVSPYDDDFKTSNTAWMPPLTSGDDIVGQMGAWQNDDEVYTDGDYVGENVRHHRFPHKNWALSTAISDAGWTNEDTKFAKLGITIDLSTVTLPSNVKGISIGYAKRDLKNATVVDVGMASHVEYKLYTDLSLEYNGTMFNFPIAFINGFIPSNPYIVGVYDYKHELAAWTTSGEISLIYKLEDNESTDNTFRPDCYFLEHTSYYTESSPSPYVGHTVQLMNNISNIYNPYSNQEIVTCAYIKNGTSKAIYEGDVYTSYAVMPKYTLVEREGGLDDVILREHRQVIITSPLIPDLMEFSGLPMYNDNSINVNMFEKGVQTLSFNRFYIRLMGLPQLPLSEIYVMFDALVNPINEFKNSIVISDIGNINDNKWLRFDTSNYYTMPNINGSIYQLITYGNALYIRTNRSIYMAKIRDTFDMSNGQVGLKSGELFDQLPQELIPTSTGFIAGNSKLATSITKIGVVIVDITTSSIYILGNEFVDLTITNKEYFKWLFNNIYEGAVNKPVNNVHLSSLEGASICYESAYNRLFITLNTKVLTFDVMSKQLISVFDIEPNYIFSLLGNNTPYYICGNSNDGFKIKKLSNSTYPDEAYIEVSIAVKDLPVIGFNKIMWNTLDGNNSTIKSISIWSDLAATGEIDIVTADVTMVDDNNTIVGNTTFDVSGMYSFNDIFDNVIDKAVSIFTSTNRYQVEINDSNININKRDTDIFATHFRIRLYLKKSGVSISNRNCKLRSLDIILKSYTSK